MILFFFIYGMIAGLLAYLVIMEILEKFIDPWRERRATIERRLSGVVSEDAP